MTEAGENQTDLQLNHEFQNLMREYSIPHIAELGQDSVLSQSQYAKVIFHDIADTYPTDADICCRYSLTNGVTVSRGDRIALYRVGWSSVQEHIAFEWVPMTEARELQVLFKASNLPKDEEEFYQLCYVTINDVVCGASVPFQFRHLQEHELCAVEEQDGMIVVRSRTAFTEEKLRQALVTNDLLQEEKGNMEKELKILEGKHNKASAELLATLQTLSKLETEKKELEKELEGYVHIERQVEQLQQDLLACEKEKNLTVSKLGKAEQHLKVLAGAVDTLSADKERMAQLLRSDTQGRSDIGQYRAQVESLTHMLEALTQSKDLVAQELVVQRAANCELQEDMRNLEIARKVLQNDLLELQVQKKILKEQAASAEKISEERATQITDLQKEKESLLIELVQAASKKEKEIRMMTEVYEGRLKDAADKVTLAENDLCTVKAEADEQKKVAVEKTEANKSLIQQLLEAQNKLLERDHSIAEVRCEKERLEGDLCKMIESQRKLIGHNENLSSRLVELENESGPRKLQLQELSDPLEKKTYFIEVFTDLQRKIANLEVALEEAMADKNVQLERLDAIAERISELADEREKLDREKLEVHALCDEGKVKQVTKEHLRNDYLMKSECQQCNDHELHNLTEDVNELTAIVESSVMRISEIDCRLEEISHERLILNQQQTDARKRQEEYEKREAEIHQELTLLQQHEREIMRDWGGPLTVLQVQSDHGLTPEEKLPVTKHEKAGLRQKLEETNSSKEQCGSSKAAEVNVHLEKEQQLKLQLQMAAVEYRKLYIEKQKVEKRLAKLLHRLNEKKERSLASLEHPVASGSAVRGQPVTGELICFSQAVVSGAKSDTALPLQEKRNHAVSSVCPVCNEVFPPEACDMFRQHFEAHLS